MSKLHGALKRKFTPAEVAQLWGVGIKTVWSWIKSGQLRAIDAGGKVGGRPRFLIDVDDLHDFEEAREVLPDRKPKRRSSRRRKLPPVTEFFGEHPQDTHSNQRAGEDK